MHAYNLCKRVNKAYNFKCFKLYFSVILKLKFPFSLWTCVLCHTFAQKYGGLNHINFYVQYKIKILEILQMRKCTHFYNTANSYTFRTKQILTLLHNNLHVITPV